MRKPRSFFCALRWMLMVYQVDQERTQVVEKYRGLLYRLRICHKRIQLCVVPLIEHIHQIIRRDKTQEHRGTGNFCTPNVLSGLKLPWDDNTGVK